MTQSVAFDDTRSISQLYQELTAYLDQGWGRARQVWVSGEVQKLSDHRSGHCYVDLVDPKATGRDVPTLKAKCWRSTWGPVKASLRSAGVRLTEGTVARVRGYVDLYAPRGELGFIITAIDIEALQLAALGEHARRRLELLRTLEVEGLLEANRSLTMPAVPVRVGLVASKGTEGYNDFVGMLEASGIAFQIRHARVAVQGANAARDLAGGIAMLERRECDVICVVRGGGSQTDLGPFDDERVARAIAGSPVPVLTGVGHTGDVSVADLVAHRAHRTPTACAEALVAIVNDWYVVHVAAPAQRVADAAIAAIDELVDDASQRRRHLVVVSRHRLQRADDALATSAAAAARHAPHALARASTGLLQRSERLGPLSRHRLDAAADRLAARRTLFAAYDPTKMLARGWSITSDASGAVVRSIEGLEPGGSLVTRLADGVARSSVTGVEPEEEAP
jgi:exodeoxyribonuclease VII large subunit